MVYFLDLSKYWLGRVYTMFPVGSHVSDHHVHNGINVRQQRGMKNIPMFQAVEAVANF